MARGRTGAKTSTFHDYNPRELVVRLMTDNPRAGFDELFGLFRNALAGPFSNFQEAVDLHCFTNQFNAVNDVPPPRPKLRVVLPSKPLPAKQVEAEKAQAVASATARLVDLAPVLFMKLPTPFKRADGSGNKTLGELTGKEGRKLTGGLAKFFKGIPDNKRLIDVKSEAKLRELWVKL